MGRSSASRRKSQGYLKGSWEGGVAVGGVVVEGALVGVGSGGLGDLDGGVGATESKTWISSDQETEARAPGRSRCSLRVRMRTEIILVVMVSRRDEKIVEQ